MTEPGTWRLRADTVQALALLVVAQIALVGVPFAWWRGSLGLSVSRVDPAEAIRLARHIRRAATRLPFAAKCLVQAMALSWQLRRRRIAHRVTLAARPHGARGGESDLHAWVAVGDQIVLGELSGPWIEVLILPLD